MNKKDAKDKIRIRGQKEMKRKTGISLMIVMLMVISTFTVVTRTAQGVSPPPLTVEKKVWDGDSWESEICNVVKGDIVKFNITVTFHNYGPCPNNYIYDILVEDRLPNGLEYKGTVSPREPDKIIGNKIIWNFTDNEKILHNEESFSIIFKAVATEYGKQKNEVNVNATEFCCGEKLTACDSAIVHVDPRLDVDKKVWDPDTEKWADYLGSVIKAVNVRFQIVVTYHGPGYITCMKVVDTFQEECPCLEYLGNEEFIYPDNDLFDDPKITVPGNLKGVNYTWSSELGILFNLADGQNVIIRFDANVTNYCYCGEYNTVTNLAEVDAWNCANCDPFVEGSDTLNVSCQPHKPIFEKTVKSGNSWVEETTARIDDIVTFKVELTYYGNYNLSNIKIIDTLPKNILEYVKDSSHLKVYHYYEHSVEKIPIQGVASENNTKVKWDIKEALNDSDTLELTFDALVIGLTGNCECCGINTAEYTAVESVTQHPYSWTDTAKVETLEKLPVKLQICVKRFGIGHVSAYIKNIGETDASNIEWNLSARYGFLGKINVESNGIISTLKKQSSTTISTSKTIRGRISRIQVIVNVFVPGEDPITRTAHGLVFGRLIILGRTT